MISLRYLKMKPMKVSEETVRNFRKSLEDATEEDFTEYAQAKRRAYIESQNYVLD